MFKAYFEACEHVRVQLLEGAITYEEYFNKVVAMAVDLTETPRYASYIERCPEGDPMGEDIENRS